MTFAQQTNIKATSWTIGVHAALLLLFILWRYTLPVNVPTPEMGMEVNLGTSDNGNGVDQPMAVEDPAANAASAAYKSVSKQDEESKDMMQSNDPEAPEANVPKPSNATSLTNTVANKSRHVNNQQDNNSNNRQQEKPRYVYNGSTGKGGNGAARDVPGTHEGNTTGNGDRGVPNGTPGATNYTGSPGNGNGGISYRLSGRSIVAYPPPEASFKEEGAVTIRITVNRDGAIVNKEVISASNNQIRAIALRKVEKVRFNKNTDAPEEQFGNITFVFKTRS